MISKKTKQGLSILIIAAIIFSIVVFFIPFEKGANFWIAYIFEIIAILAQIPIWRVAYKDKKDIKSRVLGFPIAQVGFIYLSVQSAATILLFLISAAAEDFPIWITTILCIVILGGAVSCCIATDVARDTVEEIEGKETRDIAFMKGLTVKAQNLAARVSDPALRKEVEKLAESIRYSDPVSSEKIALQDQELQFCFNQLETAVTENNAENIHNFCSKTAIALNDRNTACKLNKRQ